jgi:hypothetical protein
MAGQQEVNDNRVRDVLQPIGAPSTLALYPFAGSVSIFSAT